MGHSDSLRPGVRLDNDPVTWLDPSALRANFVRVTGGPAECRKCGLALADTGRLETPGVVRCSHCLTDYDVAWLLDEEAAPVAVAVDPGEDEYDEADDDESYDDFAHDEEDEIQFADPGGQSALRAETADNPRNLPCPDCGAPNRLTPEDVSLGYRCDACAERAERGID